MLKFAVLCDPDSLSLWFVPPADAFVALAIPLPGTKVLLGLRGPVCDCTLNSFNSSRLGSQYAISVESASFGSGFVFAFSTRFRFPFPFYYAVSIQSFQNFTETFRCMHLHHYI